MRWQNRALLLLIFATVGVGFAGGKIATIGYAGCGALALVLLAWSLFDQRFEGARWWRRAVNPIVLRSPFAQPCQVVSGGPDPRHNAYLNSSDRYFAYGFTPECGDGDYDVLAPCDGFVAWTEDRLDDAKNYVSIQTGDGFVIVGSLRKGSIAVRVADEVRVGNRIGRCTTRLNVYAQDRPQVAADIARGIPIAFLDAQGVAQVLEYGDVLKPASPA